MTTRSHSMMALLSSTNFHAATVKDTTLDELMLNRDVEHPPRSANVLLARYLVIGKLFLPSRSICVTDWLFQFSSVNVLGFGSTSRTAATEEVYTIRRTFDPARDALRRILSVPPTAGRMRSVSDEFSRARRRCVLLKENLEDPRWSNSQVMPYVQWHRPLGRLRRRHHPGVLQ